MARGQNAVAQIAGGPSGLTAKGRKGRKMFGDNYAEELKSSQNYFRLSEDQPEMSNVVFVGEPEMAWVKFDRRANKMVRSDESDAEANERFACSIYLVDEDRFAVFEGTKSLARRIRAAKVDEGDIVSMTRSGKSFSTRYQVEVKGKVNRDQAKRIVDQKLPDLSTYWTEQWGQGDGELPF